MTAAVRALVEDAMKQGQTRQANARQLGSATAAPAAGAHSESAREVGSPSQEALARRAYELFVERGAEPGRDVEDWLRAEAELRGGRQ